MPIKKQGTNKANKERNGSEWDAAIADAKERIKRLRYSISVFQASKRSGEPWTPSATQNWSSTHARVRVDRNECVAYTWRLS
jgi:hypothetical protein